MEFEIKITLQDCSNRHQSVLKADTANEIHVTYYTCAQNITGLSTWVIKILSWKNRRVDQVKPFTILQMQKCLSNKDPPHVTPHSLHEDLLDGHQHHL